MLHLALKAFYPGEAAVPVSARRHHLEVPRDDRVPRRDRARGSGSICCVHINREGLEMGINPFVHGSALHTDVMKTQALKQALDQYRLRRGVRRRAPRRGEVARQGARLLDPLGAAPVGSEAAAARALARSTTPACARARASACFRCRTGPSSTSGSTSTWRTFRSSRCTSRSERPVVVRDGTLDHGGRRPDAARAGRDARAEERALPDARLLSADRRDRKRRRRRCRRSSRRCC